MKKTTLYLEEETARAVKRLAQSEGRPQADLIREAVATYVSAATRPQPQGIGRYSSGRSDISERAEELVRKAVVKRAGPAAG